LYNIYELVGNTQMSCMCMIPSLRASVLLSLLILQRGTFYVLMGQAVVAFFCFIGEQYTFAIYYRHV